MVGHAAGDRSHHVEGIERRHARPRFTDVQPRIRQIQALARRPDGNLQQQSLGAAPLVLPDERPIDRTASLVQQQRILAWPLRDDALCQARHEHDAKRSSARLVRRAHEQASVAARRWFPVERDEAILENVPRFLESNRPHVRHGTEIRQRLPHALGPLQAARSQRVESLDPFPPGRLLRPVGERVDNRERKLPQVPEVPEIAFEAGDARRIPLLLLQLLDPELEVGREPVQAIPPSLLAFIPGAPANDGRLDNQLFPLPRRSQRAGNDRVVVRDDRLVGRSEDLLFRLDLVVGRSA